MLVDFSDLIRVVDEITGNYVNNLAAKNDTSIDGIRRYKERTVKEVRERMQFLNQKLDECYIKMGDLKEKQKRCKTYEMPSIEALVLSVKATTTSSSRLQFYKNLQKQIKKTIDEAEKNEYTNGFSSKLIDTLQAKIDSYEDEIQNCVEILRELGVTEDDYARCKTENEKQSGCSSCGKCGDNSEDIPNEI